MNSVIAIIIAMLAVALLSIIAMLAITLMNTTNQHSIHHCLKPCRSLTFFLMSFFCSGVSYNFPCVLVPEGWEPFLDNTKNAARAFSGVVYVCIYIHTYTHVYINK